MLDLSRPPPTLDGHLVVHSAQIETISTRELKPTLQCQRKRELNKQEKRVNNNEVPKQSLRNEESSEAVRIKVSFGPTSFFSLRDLPKRLTAGSVWREKKVKEKQNISGGQKINKLPCPTAKITSKTMSGVDPIKNGNKMTFHRPPPTPRSYDKKRTPLQSSQRTIIQNEALKVTKCTTRTKQPILRDETNKPNRKNEGQKSLYGPFLSGQGKLQTIKANPLKRAKIVANHMFQVLKQMMPTSNFEIRIKGNSVYVNVDTETIDIEIKRLEENMRDLATTDEVLRREGFFKAPSDWNKQLVDRGSSSWRIIAFCLLHDARNQSIKLLEQSGVGHYRERIESPTIEDICTRSAGWTFQAKDST